MDDQPTTVDDQTLKARMAVIDAVLKERRHQIRCGHTPAADASLTLGELSQAAMATIAVADDAGAQGEVMAGYFWPFDYRQMPRTSLGRRWLLVKAMALLLAELERLPRPGLTGSPAVPLPDSREEGH